MNIDYVNGYLESLGLLNEGVNHNSTFTFEIISEEANLKESLDKYFSKLYLNTAKQSDEVWEIEIVPIEKDWQKKLSEVLHKWFFEDEFSPPNVESWVKDNVIDIFIHHLKTIVGNVAVFEVFFNTQLFYECYWQDFAFQSEDKIWLLHLGLSD